MKGIRLVGFTLLMLLVLGTAIALADEEEQVVGQPYPVSGLGASIDSQALASQLIDSEAATELPHSDLDRNEAGELAESVFGGVLESSAGPFANLQVEKFLSDSAALVAAGSSALQPAVTIGGEKASQEETAQADGLLLLDATLPLRTEDETGQERVVDLDLEPGEGELQAANPLVEVGIPGQLGEGISIPSGSVTLDTGESAAERSPSVLGGNVAFYPNVAADTDFAVAPTPTGLETFTQLRSADAPLSHTLQLDLNAGADLEADGEGGAVATAGGEEVLKVLPPTAIDANGKSVPVSLGVTEDTLTLNASPDASSQFPILVDPVIIESWPWNEKNTSVGMDNGNGSGTGDWRSWRNTTAFSATYNVPWSTPPGPLKMWMPGLTVTTGYSGTVSVGSQANWNYYVPRYFTDYTETGKRPTTFIQNMQMWNLVYAAYSKQASPWMAAGLWDEEQGKWVSFVTRNGTEGSLENFSYLYNFPNPSYVQTAKNAGMGLLSSEAGANNGRILYVGYAALSLNDLDYPTGTITAPGQWVDSVQGAPFTFSFEDKGLGIASVTITDRQSPQHTWTTSMSCTGVASNPCPRKISSPGTKLNLDPSVLPQGSNILDVKIADPIGNTSSATVTLRVDHTAPAVSLGGSITEQATLGKTRTSYSVALDAVDGSEAPPAFSSAFGTTGSGSGQFKHPAGIAVDSSRNAIWVVDQDNKRVEKFNEAGEYQSSFGSSGTGDGKFSRPTDVAVDAKGNIWVIDGDNCRLQKFNEKGEFLLKVGTVGTGNGQFNDPESLAIDPKGNVWVADTWNGRLQKFNEKGEFLKVVGSKGTGQGQMIEATGLAIDAKGNLWVADWGNNRVTEFSEEGSFIRQFGSEGTGNGQFRGPDVIEVDSKGGVWVGDQWNDRIQGFSQTGEYVTQFGAKGTGQGQFSFGWPMGLATDSKGSIWISDTGNNRVQKWNLAPSTQAGIASTAIKVDGKTVESTSAGCSTQNCSVSKSWTLKNLDYAVGTHTVEVTGTDAVGRTASKKLTIEIQRDVAAPSLSLSGSLKKAPGGWINQPNNYEVSAVSTDNGFGTTALKFEVDKTVLDQATQTCSVGGCALNDTFAINANSYTGGEHEAAVVAEDGAGNKQRSSWSFKVNVDGVPTPAEVASMSNALIGGTGTSSPSSSIEGFPYEPTTAPENEGEGENVAIAGSGARGGISLTASEGFNLAGLSGLPFLMAPVGAGSTTGQAVVGGDAVSYPGVWSGIDLLVRPSRNGVSNYVVVHEKAALRTVTWEVIGPNPVALTKREDGGVDVTITPSEEVRAFEGSEEEEALSDEPQVVASIAPPYVVDGEGTTVPAAFSVNENEVTLTLTPTTGAVYPVNAEIGVHLQGALATWNPLSAAKPETPSEVPVTAIGITSQAGPVGTEWSSNATGTEVTMVRPNTSGVPITQTIPISKAYETWIVQPPIEYYAPTSEATASCVLGFCAGNILCSAVGPQRPFGPPVQTYGLITCTVQGDQPKDFEYEKGGACLQRRFGINGQVLWATEKCHNTFPHYGNANWQVAKEVAKGCDSGVWRGEAWVTVVTARAVSTTGSVTAGNFKC